MRLSALFPVRIVEDEIEVDDLRPGIAETIASGVLDGRPEDKRSALGNAWRSRLNLHGKQGMNDACRLLVERVEAFTSKALTHLYRAPKFTIGECWLNKLGRGGYNAPHDHHPYDWSGVVWIDTEGPHDNEPNGAFEFMSPYYSRAFNDPNGSLMIHPINGVALLFPSGLKHMVHPVLTDRSRISMAWNIHVELSP